MDKITSRQTPASEIINDYTYTHRYLSSEERRDLLDLVWRVIRTQARLCYAYPNDDWQTRIERLRPTLLAAAQQLLEEINSK